MADIFLSYTRVDRIQAARLVRRLEGEGWSVFWDTEILSGDGWARKIRGELDCARCVIVCWSKAAVRSRWVRKEADTARERGVLLPVSLDGAMPPPGFGDIQTENLLRWNRWWNGSRDNAAITRALIAVSQRLDPMAELSHMAPPHDEPWIRFRHVMQATAAVLIACIVVYEGYEPYFSWRRQSALAAVTDWGLQLRSVDPQALAVLNPHDMMVIDYETDHQRRLKPSEIASLRRRPNGQRRLLLAYLSIGEAEKRRYYWQSGWANFDGQLTGNPDWIVEKTENDAGYFIKYWSPAWHDIVYKNPRSYLRKIIEQGFDGVYLDIAKGVSFWLDRKHKAANSEMIALIENIAKAARVSNPNFLVMVEHGDQLIATDAAPDPGFMKAIDAVGREDLILFSHPVLGTTAINKLDAVQTNIARLGTIARAGKTVFVIEYAESSALTDYARSALLANGFKPHFSVSRELERRSGYSKLKDLVSARSQATPALPDRPPMPPP